MNRLNRYELKELMKLKKALLEEAREQEADKKEQEAYKRLERRK